MRGCFDLEKHMVEFIDRAFQKDKKSSSFLIQFVMIVSFTILKHSPINNAINSLTSICKAILQATNTIARKLDPYRDGKLDKDQYPKINLEGPFTVMNYLPTPSKAIVEAFQVNSSKVNIVLTIGLC
jgi:hypothetical protein